ncbi:hypothetical protein OPIT5_22080 [Opitutaceae bacterium TAV5]|nr:hypothetical protein OPIT5_22080 [Opitutaceae bacterium TAV5]
MQTVLLWGNKWWLENTAAPVSFTSLADAVGALASALPPGREKRLRLVYQPDDLVSAPTHCPNGTRNLLAITLGPEHPALVRPGYAWSHEPIRRDGEGFETILHYETTPALFDLVADLEGHGFVVESAWPLGTFLHALPLEWPASGAVSVAAVERERVCALRQETDGKRSLHHWHGDNAVDEFGRWLGGIVEQNPGDSVLLVSGKRNAANIRKLLDRKEGREDAAFECIPLPDALVRAVVLPRKHPAQLLPPARLANPQVMAMAASVALLAGAAGFAVPWLGAQVAAHPSGPAQAARIATLETEVARLNTEAEQVIRARERAPDSGPPVGFLLHQLSTLPSQIALGSLRVSADGFTLTGHVAPDTSPRILEQWQKQSGSTGNAWRWPDGAVSAEQIGSGGAFTLHGVFQTGQPAGRSSGPAS